MCKHSYIRTNINEEIELFSNKNLVDLLNSMKYHNNALILITHSVDFCTPEFSKNAVCVVIIMK